MRKHQEGVLNLVWVAIFSALLAAAAMAAIYSMRHERNLFAEGWAKVAGAAPAQEMANAARKAVADPAKGDGAMRKCVIDGKTVISNTDCAASNPTSKVIAIHDTKGFEAPKAAPPADSAPAPKSTTDKIIEKQLH